MLWWPTARSQHARGLVDMPACKTVALWRFQKPCGMAVPATRVCRRSIQQAMGGRVEGRFDRRSGADCCVIVGVRVDRRGGRSVPGAGARGGWSYQAGKLLVRLHEDINASARMGVHLCVPPGRGGFVAPCPRASRWPARGSLVVGRSGMCHPTATRRIVHGIPHSSCWLLSL